MQHNLRTHQTSSTLWIVRDNKLFIILIYQLVSSSSSHVRHRYLWSINFCVLLCYISNIHSFYDWRYIFIGHKQVKNGTIAIVLWMNRWMILVHYNERAHGDRSHERKTLLEQNANVLAKWIIPGIVFLLHWTRSYAINLN